MPVINAAMVVGVLPHKNLELGGVHVPDPARGEGTARNTGRTADLEHGPENHHFGWIVTLVPRVGIARTF
jgi:hypothetical protein